MAFKGRATPEDAFELLRKAGIDPDRVDQAGTGFSSWEPGGIGIYLENTSMVTLRFHTYGEETKVLVTGAGEIEDKLAEATKEMNNGVKENDPHARVFASRIVNDRMKPL